MRRGELHSMEWSWVDMKNRIISIPAINTKTKTSRKIPISDFTFDILKDMKKTEGRIFSRYSLERISKKFKRYCKIANLPKDIHFHNLRHTFASWLVINGGDIYTIKELLGHSTIKTTEVYASLTHLNLKNEINKLHM